MLEGFIGSSPMRTTPREDATRHAYGAASLDAFRTAAERASKKDLRWFFEQWVMTNETPELSLTWSYSPASSGGGKLRVEVSQAGTTQPFRMRLKLRVQETLTTAV